MKETRALLLAAGLGTRLKPLTDIWPKCLMPIHNRPLLEYWLEIIKKIGIDSVLVNTHYLSEYVNEFIKQPHFVDWVSLTYEEKLLGTAGTIRDNIKFSQDKTLLLVHADNWVCCNFFDFLHYHHNQRPKGTVMTMMTFICYNPSECGIVELDNDNIVLEFHEKVEDPPGKLANAAVYLIEPEVIRWIEKHSEVTDFSTEVLPQFIGRIATWENCNIHKDIGTIEMLREAQLDQCENQLENKSNPWQQGFLNNPVHNLI